MKHTKPAEYETFLQKSEDFEKLCKIFEMCWYFDIKTLGLEERLCSIVSYFQTPVTEHDHDLESLTNSGCGSPKQKNSSRRNAWGNQSYADLITQAIKSTPEQRLTLSQIYDWVVKNVPYFKDKGDSASSSGWKVKS